MLAASKPFGVWEAATHTHTHTLRVLFEERRQPLGVEQLVFELLGACLRKHNGRCTLTVRPARWPLCTAKRHLPQPSSQVPGAKS